MVAVTTVFYRMATNGSLFGSLKRIRETFGFTLEQNYALTEGPFIKMARTYWIFKLEVEDLFEKDSNLLNLQYAILEKLKVDHPHVRDKELWTMVLKSRSLSRLNRGAPGIPNYEIERIIRKKNLLTLLG